jgi:hypothetical protein
VERLFHWRHLNKAAKGPASFLEPLAERGCVEDQPQACTALKPGSKFGR